MEDNRLLPLVLDKIKHGGKIRFDIGTFHIIKRRKQVIKLLTTGKVKKVGLYKALFFRASDTLKRELNK